MKSLRIAFILLIVFTKSNVLFAQNEVTVNAKLDAVEILVGDQIKMFIEAKKNGNATLQWANIPDTFNKLEIVERGKIDTTTQGATTVYKQRLLVTGFDSGLFKVPPFQFSVIPQTGNAYIINTDSFLVSVSTVPVDTSKAFRGIKNIIAVKASWTDYILWIIVGIHALIGIALLIRHFTKKKKPAKEVIPEKPAETLHQKTLRLLNELDAKQLWQKGSVKLYYVELTDILRGYIEQRFKTPAMELTTDELLTKSHSHKEMSRHYDELSQILHTADLAKFAKAQPLPYEHTQTLEQAKAFVNATKPVIVETNNNPQS